MIPDEAPVSPLSPGESAHPERTAAPRHAARGLRDIAHLFLSSGDAAQLPAHPVSTCTIGPDWHRRQMEKIISTRRMLARLHEMLASPIETIAQHAPLALQTIPDDAPGRSHLVAVRRAADELAATWRAVSELLRRVPAACKPVPLGNIVQHVLQLFPSLSHESPIRLALKLGEPQACTCGDEALLEMAIFPLVRNAVEAMASTGGLLTLTIETDESAVVLTISDTGQGIPAELIEHVAQPLVTTRAERGNVGMGLTTALSIIDALGGTVSLSSEVGKGTTVAVSFPIAERLEKLPPLAP